MICLFQQARERLSTYRSKMSAKIAIKVNGEVKTEFIRECGSVPVMVRVSLVY